MHGVLTAETGVQCDFPNSLYILGFVIYQWAFLSKMHQNMHEIA